MSQRRHFPSGRRSWYRTLSHSEEPPSANGIVFGSRQVSQRLYLLVLLVHPSLSASLWGRTARTKHIPTALPFLLSLWPVHCVLARNLPLSRRSESRGVRRPIRWCACVSFRPVATVTRRGSTSSNFLLGARNGLFLSQSRQDGQRGVGLHSHFTPLNAPLQSAIPPSVDFSLSRATRPSHGHRSTGRRVDDGLFWYVACCCRAATISCTTSSRGTELLGQLVNQLWKRESRHSGVFCFCEEGRLPPEGVQQRDGVGRSRTQWLKLVGQPPSSAQCPIQQGVDLLGVEVYSHIEVRRDHQRAAVPFLTLRNHGVRKC